jgi:hypothetical protein
MGYHQMGQIPQVGERYWSSKMSPSYDYQWRNPRSDNRGKFRIGSCLNDPYGFRVCRQPNSSGPP